MIAHINSEGLFKCHKCGLFYEEYEIAYTEYDDGHPEHTCRSCNHMPPMCDECHKEMEPSELTEPGYPTNWICITCDGAAHDGPHYDCLDKPQ